MTYNFKLDGIQGAVFSDGWIRWCSVSCHVNSLGNCDLKTLVLKIMSESEGNKM